MGALSISVVIPALDEEAGVGLAVSSVSGDAEVLVVDGGSSDRTRDVAAAAGARILESPRGRGRQLDAGARACSGAWIVFLHADTRLEPGWADALRRVPQHVVGGAFRFAIDSTRRAYRVIEAGVALRCRVLRLPYGDQALFARRTAYEAIGGFPPLPLMEDVAFVRRLRRAGTLALLEPRAFTSPRRWERRGILPTTLRNWCLVSLYTAGVVPEHLARAYGRSPSR